MKPKLLWHFCVSLLLHLNNNNNLPFFNTLIFFKIHTNNFYFSLYLVSFIFKLPQSQNTCHAFCCIQKHCFVTWMCLHVYIIQPQVNVHFFFKDCILFSTQIMCYKLRKNFMLLVFKILLHQNLYKLIPPNFITSQILSFRPGPSMGPGKNFIFL